MDFDSTLKRYQDDPASNVSTIMTTTKDPTFAATGAVGLLEKYNKLNQAIDSIRSETIKSQHEISDLQTHIASLKRETRSYMKQTKQAHKDSSSFQLELRELAMDHQSKEQEKRNTLHLKIQALRELEIMKRTMDDERRSFIDTCRSFRTSVQRTRCSLASLPAIPGCKRGKATDISLLPDLQHIHNKDESYEVSSSDEGSDEEMSTNFNSSTSTCHKASTNMSRRSESDQVDFDGQNHNEEHSIITLAGGIVPKSISRAEGGAVSKDGAVEDAEMLHAEQRRRSALQMKNNMIKILKELRQKSEGTGKRSKERMVILGNQRIQLDRLKNDVDRMSRSLVATERDTIEMSEKDAESRKETGYQRNDSISSSHEKGYSRDHQRKQNVSPRDNYTRYNDKPVDKSKRPSSVVPNVTRVVHNPYKKRRHQVNVSSSTGSDIKKNPNLKHPSIVANAQKDSQLAQQYPHREGRIRVDRQFTTALSVSVGQNEEDTTFISTTEGGRKNDHYFPEHRLDESKTNYQPADLSSSSDDDDDFLLSFKPFKKSSK